MPRLCDSSFLSLPWNESAALIALGDASARSASSHFVPVAPQSVAASSAERNGRRFGDSNITQRW